MELRHRRGQSRDPGRDPDRDIQHIIDHQRGGGEQAGIGPEIFLGNGIRAAIARIRLDRLPVRGAEHGQKHWEAAMTGVITCSPKAPAGIRIVSAASGP
jgi:hypothetical protein